MVTNDLTERERSIIRGVAAGKKNAEIAAAVGITLASVRVRLTTIYAKTFTRNRTELAVKAIHEGIAESGAANG